MLRKYTAPECWPPDVPGYVPVCNNIVHDTEAIAKHLRELGIPAEDAFTLPNLVKGLESTTYALEKHKPVIDAFSEYVQSLLNQLWRF